MGEKLREYHDRLLDYKKELREIVGKSTDAYEKQLSYLCGGSLALSFVVVEKVIGNIYQSRHKEIIVIGWVLLTVSLLINLLSQYATAELHNKTIGEIDLTVYCDDEEMPERERYSDEKVNSRNKRVGYYNRGSTWLLILGISCILTFTTINLSMNNKGQNTQHSNPLNEGQKSSQPIIKPTAPNKANTQIQKGEDSYGQKSSTPPTSSEKKN